MRLARPRLFLELQHAIENRHPDIHSVRHDSSHAHSASWATRELMPNAGLWDMLPPHQNGRNTLEQVLKFKVQPGLQENRRRTACVKPQ
jgi:hypothetical protein